MVLACLTKCKGERKEEEDDLKFLYKMFLFFMAAIAWAILSSTIG
jgi:hypothetical protein